MSTIFQLLYVLISIAYPDRTEVQEGTAIVITKPPPKEALGALYLVIFLSLAWTNIQK